MPSIDHITVEASGSTSERGFYTAIGVGDRVRVQISDEPSTGFRGFVLGLVVSQPATVDGPAGRHVDEVVLQLGVADVSASKQFYADRGFSVVKRYGRRYVELDTGPVSLTLNKRDALARTVDLPPDGDGSHRLLIRGDVEPFTDPDGYVWGAA